ncbi:MAG: tetraacyldisaccharide 4'-kinase [Phycisphaerales bacterium]|nr:tetraacyldisaccharide 4'-kinase [Phycisphaerales bacterium]
MIKRRNRAFDAGRGVITFDRPVISVGNLSLGGTGKTPMVERIVRSLRLAGHDPCIAMRGYGSRRNAGGLSDEAELYRANLDDLPIVAQPDRAEGLIKLFASERGERVDCIVLDDGFQHRRIARAMDIVLIDASIDPFGAALFPAGRLREPIESLRRATHTVLTHAELVEPALIDALGRQLAERGAPPPCAVACHEWTSLRVFDRGAEAGEREVAWLRGRRIVAACAIGRPQAFLAGLSRAGAVSAESIVLRDHDRFGPGTLRRLLHAAEHAEALVCTEKDWTKLRARGLAWPCPVLRPILTLEFQHGWQSLHDDILSAAARAPD